MTRRWLVAGTVVFASAGGAGCTDPVLIEANTCGNLVQESGEDCDRPDGLCTPICHFACSIESPTTCADIEGSPALDGACCPSGSSCGADGSCRWPAGTFASVATAPYGMYQYEAADLDGDHIDDLLGVSAGNVVAAYGAFDTPFASHLTRAGVSATSAAIGDFVGDAAGEGDGRPDVAFTSARAIYVLDTRTGAPEPYAFAHRYQDDRVFLRSSQAALVSVLLGARQEQAELEWELPNARGSTRPCDLATPVERVAGTGLQPFPITSQLAAVPVLLRPRDQAQCMGGQASACAQICIQALPPTPAAPSIVIALPEDPGDGEIFFGELDGNDCGDLVFPSLTGVDATTRVWFGVRGPDQKCGFVTSSFTVSGTPLGTVLQGGGRHWLATSTGVYDLGGRVLNAVIEAPPSGWTQIADGDFDGDGAIDFAARSGGVPEIEIYQRRFVPQGPEQWRLQRIPTIGGTLVKLDVGDFDANGFDDVALAAIDSFSSYQAQISVAYSDGQTFSPPTSIATVVGFRDLAAADLPDPSLDPTLDVFDDLTVLHDAGSPPLVVGTITRLYGGGDRVMTSPWRTVPTEALALSFVDDASLVTISFDKGASKLEARRLVLGARGFAEAGARGDANLTARFNTFARLPLATGETVVFAMTNSDTSIDEAESLCATIMDPGSLQTRGVPCSTLLPNAPPDQFRDVERVTVVPGDPLRLHVLRSNADVVYNDLYDVDVSGADPVLSNHVHLEPAIDEQLGAERFRIYCAPFTSIELGGRGTGRELAIACTHVDGRLMDIRTTIFLRFTRDAEPPQWERLEIEELSAELRTGDVNGDGLEDLLVSGSSNVTTAFLQRECDARTEGCR